ncbi:MAG TPA: ECF transporter S component [Candidatus Bathyarchaeia archaeon]|nr:ECF transporter S component [Candidatus Bathyarchaeia archaeon]
MKKLKILGRCLSTARSADVRTSVGRRTPTVKIAITAAMTALVFIITKFISVPISVVAGQVFDAGDIMIFIAAWTFGSPVGGFAGGIGSALSDFLSGGFYAPFTLIIKGSEGAIAGRVAQRSKWGRKTSWILAGCVMVGGYFLTNWFLMGLVFGAGNGPGLGSAVLELPFDILQVGVGGLIAGPVSQLLKKSIAFDRADTRVG